jgi:signal transduction histidine kinase
MDSPEAINTYYLLFVGSLGMLLLACASIFFFVIYHKRNIRAKEEMYEMETRHQQTLIHSNLQTLEDERKRFAEDLHDEIGASLSAIRLHVSRLEIEAAENALKTQLKEVKGIIDQSMASTRRISHNMLPPGLEMFGLMHIVEDLAKTVSQPDLQVKADIQADLPRLPYNTELALYRILQELLNNTIKHAKASEVMITIAVDADRYILSYRDNGKGFDAASVRYAGLGLRNMESRTNMIQGSFHFDTSPGKGLFVEITIPLTNQTTAS